MKSPELNEIFRLNKLIDSIVGLSAQEGRSSIEHNEQNDSSSKQVSCKTSIVSLIYLRGLVSLCANSGSKFIISIVTLCVSGQTKIRDFECKVTIEENILRFEVTMRNINAHQILDGKQYLFEIHPANFRSESPCFG